MKKFLLGAGSMVGWLVLQACGSDPASPGGGTGTSPEGGSSTAADSGSGSDGGGGGVLTRLDLSCNGTGRAVYPVGIGKSADLARGVAVLSGGKSLLVGTVDQPTSTDSIQGAFFASLRINPDCSIDTSYGSAGLAYFTVSDPDYQQESIEQVLPQADGSALIFGQSLQTAGTQVQQPAVTSVKITASGTKDAALGTPHVSLLDTPTSPFPSTFAVRAAELQPDGSHRILAESANSVAFLTFAGGAFAANPRIVSTATLATGYEAYRVEGMHVNGDGSVLVAGSFQKDNGTPQIPGVVKLKADGTIDTTFGLAGVGGTGTAGDLENRTFLAVQPDGKILVASVLEIEGGYQSFGVIRLNADGSVDLTFGTGGVARVVIGGAAAAGKKIVHELEAFTLQANGTMLLGGQVYSLDAASGTPTATFHVGIARLLPSGAVDASFVDGGTFDGVAASGSQRESLNGLEDDGHGTISAIATHENAQDDSDWVLYRFAPTR